MHIKSTIYNRKRVRRRLRNEFSRQSAHMQRVMTLRKKIAFDGSLQNEKLFIESFSLQIYSFLTKLASTPAVTMMPEIGSLSKKFPYARVCAPYCVELLQKINVK